MGKEERVFLRLWGQAEPAIEGYSLATDQPIVRDRMIRTKTRLVTLYPALKSWSFTGEGHDHLSYYLKAEQVHAMFDAASVCSQRGYFTVKSCGRRARGLLNFSL